MITSLSLTANNSVSSFKLPSREKQVKRPGKKELKLENCPAESNFCLKRLEETFFPKILELLKEKRDIPTPIC